MYIIMTIGQRSNRIVVWKEPENDYTIIIPPLTEQFGTRREGVSVMTINKWSYELLNGHSDKTTD